MFTTIGDKLVVAISSRALFDLDASHQVFEDDGVNAYAAYQIAHEDSTLEPGVAFNMAKKLLAIRAPDSNESLVEIVLVSRNSADTGLRIFNSIRQHELEITRAVFTSGNTPYQYLRPLGAVLFLSAHSDDVASAIAAGCAAATILPQSQTINASEQLRIAFDGDAVLFSGSAEQVFTQQGLEDFHAQETQAAKQALTEGPFKGFLAALHDIQNQFPEQQCPIRTALVTARSAPAHERVIRTLRAWRIRIDEAIFLGGLDKADFLSAFSADFFFDDHKLNCQSASQKVATGHVPQTVMDTEDKKISAANLGE